VDDGPSSGRAGIDLPSSSLSRTSLGAEMARGTRNTRPDRAGARKPASDWVSLPLSDLYVSAYVGAEFFQLGPSVQTLSRKDAVIHYAHGSESLDGRQGVLDLVSVGTELQIDRCRPRVAADAIDAAGMRGCPLRVSGGMPSYRGGKISSPIAAMKGTLKFVRYRLAAERRDVENHKAPHDTQQETQGERLQASAHGHTLAAGSRNGRQKRVLGTRVLRARIRSAHRGTSPKSGVEGKEP
jgi:hypothetical protein